jgi:hypothetical protein
MNGIDPERDAAQRKYRLRRINRFNRLVERFGLRRLSEIADWCAREPGSLKRNEKLRVQAYHDLEQSVLNGEFGPPQKPCLAYLPNFPTGELGRLTIRLTSGQLVALREWGGNPVADLWALPDMCARWFAARQMLLPPWLTTPPGQVRDHRGGEMGVLPLQGVAAPKRLRGSKPTKRDTVASYLASKYPDGNIPADVPLKSIAKETGVSERTVRRALGRK